MDRTNIINNDFFDATAKNVIIEGESYYKIEGNRFNNTPVAISSMSSGDDYNLIICNYFDSHSNGIKFNGFNEQTQFLDNCIHNNLSIGTVLDDGATIRFEQGSPGRIANNCLQSALDILAPMTSTNFSYWVKSSPFATFCDPNDFACQRPTNNLSDGGSNNYFLYQYPTVSGGCLLSGEERFNPNLSLSQARQNEYDSYQSWQANPANLELKRAYEEAKEYTHYILRYNLRSLLQNNDFETAYNILLPDTSIFELKLSYAIRILDEDYSTAVTLLNSFPSQTTDEQWFKQIQTINLARLQTPDSYILSEQNEQFLNGIIESNSTVRSYAKSLMAVLKGESYAISVSPTMSPYSRNISHNSIHQSNLIVFPNTGNNSLKIKYSGLPDSEMQLILFNSMGHKLRTFNVTLKEIETIDISKLQEGLYFICFVSANGEIFEREEVYISK